MGKRNSLEERLRAEIVSGAYGASGRLPSQEELGRQFGCSRSTVVRAIESLRRNGLVDCRQGMGVFAKASGEHRPIERLFVVCPYRRVPSQGDQYVIAVNDVVNSDLNVSFISSQCLGEWKDSLRQGGSAVIWLRPGESDLSFIESLARLGQPQLLVNRHYGDYDALWTDSSNGIRRGVAWLVEQGGPELAFIAPQPVIGKPYIAERMMHFYEACFAVGVRLREEMLFKSDFTDLVNEIDQVAGRIFLDVHPPRGIFILNYKIAVPFVIGALKYGKRLGTDYNLLVFDEATRLRDKAGAAMLVQPYQLISQEIDLWLKQVLSGRGKHREPFRKALECVLEVTK